MTFIESKLLDPLSKFTPCEFAKEDISDYIKLEFDTKEKNKVEVEYKKNVL